LHRRSVLQSSAFSRSDITILLGAILEPLQVRLTGHQSPRFRTCELATPYTLCNARTFVVLTGIK
jgi:hypothetical protein